MPKKRHTNLFSKPPTTAHHAPASKLGSGDGTGDGSKSVNELLMSLRASHISPINQVEPLVHAPSMPTAIRQLLDLPETPAPRPRGPRRRIGPDGRRLPAGPPPPVSWLGTSMHAPEITHEDGEVLRPRTAVDMLPGSRKTPIKGSLVDMALRTLAHRWEFHREYDQHHLAILPTSLRILLLSYLASDGPEEGVGKVGFERIMGIDVANEDFGGNDDFDRLDLSGSYGRSISHKQLKSLILDSNTPDKSPEEEEDWDLASFSLVKTPTTKVANLTHLSLAHAPDSISWKQLLSLAPHLATLTHLSLASWPTPQLTPNSTTTQFHSRYIQPLTYGGTGFYAHTFDQDWTEAASVLRRLSSSLYSLQWLDLDGCAQWVRALRWSKTPGIDWVGKWGRIRVLKLRSGLEVNVDENNQRLVTAEIVKHKQRVVEAMEVEKWIRQLRGWIDVQMDDFEVYDNWLENSQAVTRLNNRLLEEAKIEWVEEGINYERHLRSSWDG